MASPAPQLALLYFISQSQKHLLLFTEWFTLEGTPGRSSNPTPSSEQVQLDQVAQGLVQEIRDTVLKHWENHETFQGNHIEK